MNLHPKYFGIGLSRTGTKSLTLALEQLGLHVVHYPRDATTLKELTEGTYEFSVLKDCDGITDITVSPFYPQLDALYPGSKFILTVRDKESWLRSMSAFFSKPVPPHKAANQTVMQMRQVMRFAVYGSYSFNYDRFSYVYDLHLKNVREYFRSRPESLLTIDICGGEGWEKLCPFVGKDVPGAAFPSIRGTSDLKRKEFATAA